MDEAKELFGKGSLENVHEDNFDGEKEINNIENQITKQGDLWILDDHRLVCGDSTNDEYYKLVLDGKKADLIETEPHTILIMVKLYQEMVEILLMIIYQRKSSTIFY